MTLKESCFYPYSMGLGYLRNAHTFTILARSSVLRVHTLSSCNVCTSLEFIHVLGCRK